MSCRRVRPRSRVLAFPPCAETSRTWPKWRREDCNPGTGRSDPLGISSGPGDWIYLARAASIVATDVLSVGTGVHTKRCPSPPDRKRQVPQWCPKTECILAAYQRSAVGICARRYARGKAVPRRYESTWPGLNVAQPSSPERVGTAGEGGTVLDDKTPSAYLEAWSGPGSSPAISKAGAIRRPKAPLLWP